MELCPNHESKLTMRLVPDFLLWADFISREMKTSITTEFFFSINHHPSVDCFEFGRIFAEHGPCNISMSNVSRSKDTMIDIGRIPSIWIDHFCYYVPVVGVDDGNPLGVSGRRPRGV